jgi:hypothetical protein
VPLLAPAGQRGVTAGVLASAFAAAAAGRPHNEQNPPRLRSGCGPAAVVEQPSIRGDVMAIASQDRQSYRQQANRITLS